MNIKKIKLKCLLNNKNTIILFNFNKIKIKKNTKYNLKKKD